MGLGVLAGSTIMLLTVAWGGCLVAGRCDLSEKGTAVDRTLTKPFAETGVTTDEQTKVGATIMALSALPFLIVQIPLLDGHPAEGPEAALIGAVVCAVGLVAYGTYQVWHTYTSQPCCILYPSSCWERFDLTDRLRVHSRMLRALAKHLLADDESLFRNAPVITEAWTSLVRFSLV